jgi:hypothetical protein
MTTPATAKKTPQPIKTGLSSVMKRIKQVPNQAKNQIRTSEGKNGLWTKLMGLVSKPKTTAGSPLMPGARKAVRVDETALEEKIEKLVDRSATDSARLRKHFSISQMDLVAKADPLTAKIWVMKAILIPRFRYPRFQTIFMKFDESAPANYEYLADVFLGALQDLNAAGELADLLNVRVMQLIYDAFGQAHQPALIRALSIKRKLEIRDSMTVNDVMEIKKN